MSNLNIAEIAKVLKLTKLPIPAELQEQLTHKQVVLRLFRSCAKTARYAWKSRGRSTHFRGYRMPHWKALMTLREVFRQRKRETDPELIRQYVHQGELFVARWGRAVPLAWRSSVGGIFHQRNEAFPPHLLKEEAHIDFETLNKMESEIDFYVNRAREELEEDTRRFDYRATTTSNDKSKGL